MEETALGELGGFADVLDARRRVPLGADDVQRSVEEPDLGFVLCFVGVHCVPLSQWRVPYQLVGMLSRGDLPPSPAPSMPGEQPRDDFSEDSPFGFERID